MSRQVGPYLLERVLGRGAMGEVHVAVGPDGRRVALKLLTRFDGKSERRFSREYEVGKGLEHPHLVRTLAAGTDAGVPWLAMELIDGRTLGALLKERGALPMADVLALLRQATSALAYLHGRGVVHRDLKPENLMVDRAGALKVMDLGLLRAADLTVLTATGTVAGTPFYMAPENLEGKPATPASDLFTAALIAYELLTARHPFRAREQPDLAAYYRHLIAARPDPVGALPQARALDTFFARALAPTATSRPATAEALLAGLEAAARGEAPDPDAEATVPLEPARSGPALGPTVPGPAVPPARRPRRALAGVLLALGLAAWYAATREPAVQLVDTALLQGLEARWVVAAIAPGLPLALARVRAVGTAGEGRVQAFELPAGTSSLELRTGAGKLLLAREAEAGAWQPPPVPEARYTADGSLELVFPPARLVELGLETPGGGEVAPRAAAGGRTAFLLAPSGDAGFPALGLVARVGLARLAWGRLPARPAAGVAAAALVHRLARLDVLALARRMETDPDPAHLGLEAFEATRAAAELPGLADWIGARLDDDGPEDEVLDGLVRELPKLRFVDALLRHVKADAPLGLEDLGLADRLAPVGYAKGEPAPGPALILFAPDKVRFVTELGETQASIASPESLLAQAFGTRRLDPPPEPRGPVWLDVHVRRVDAWAPRFYAVARVNGQGPFLLLENPRLGAELRNGEPGGPWFNRRYRVRLPRRVLRPEGNDVELRFPAWTTRYEDPDDPAYQYLRLHDAACIQAIALRGGRRPGLAPDEP